MSSVNTYLNTAASYVLAPPPQGVAIKKLQKEIKQKHALIERMKTQAQVIATHNPEGSKQLNRYIHALEQRVVELKAQKQLEQTDQMCTRIGKMSLLANVVVAGAGNVLTLLSVAGKTANVLNYALSSSVNKGSLLSKAKELGWDYAFNGTWYAAAYFLKQ